MHFDVIQLNHKYDKNVVKNVVKSVVKSVVQCGVKSK